MTINGKSISIKRFFFLALYYSFARHLPSKGLFSGKRLRRWCCKHIFKHCGKEVNVERGAFFGTGINVSLGDYSGLGINCHIPSDTIIGNYVMMGPNCFIYQVNHKYDDINIPIMFQGMDSAKQTIIEDDVWLGGGIIMTPGRHIAKGTVIAANCVLCKDFPEYSVVGGNPSRLIKSRRNEKEDSSHL